MKTLRLPLLLLLSCWFVQCRKPESNDLTSDQRTIKIMEVVAPKVVGTWILDQVHMKAMRPISAGITKDTVFTQLATLELSSATNIYFSPKQAKYPEFKGQLTYRDKTLPVSFYLITTSEYLVKGTGPQAFFHFDFNFPKGTPMPDEEARFLMEISLIGDSFLLNVDSESKTMIWKGLNNDIDTIVLKKR